MTETCTGCKSHHNTSLTGAFKLFPGEQREHVREKTVMTHHRVEGSTFVFWAVFITFYYISPPP